MEMKKILVIGEQCVDKFVYCNAKRLSPEAPVAVLNPIRTTKNQNTGKSNNRKKEEKNKSKQ